MLSINRVYASLYTRVIVKHSNLLIYFLVVKVKYMLSIWLPYAEYILEIIVIVKRYIF
jgi:hypothetical protein